VRRGAASETPASCRTLPYSLTPATPTPRPQVVLDEQTGEWGETIDVQIAAFGLNADADRGADAGSGGGGGI
jgi:hypothetical protein